MQEYYKILGLNIWATMDEVIETYTRLAIKNSPNNWWTHYLFNIIHYAYNEIINNFNNEELNKQYLLLDNYEVKHKWFIQEKIIDSDVEYITDEEEANQEIEEETKANDKKHFIKIDHRIPSPQDISKEIYNVFKSLDTNPFIKDSNYNLEDIVSKLNEIKTPNKNRIFININDLIVREWLLGKKDILSHVWPAIDLALYICDFHNYDVNNKEAKAYMRILMIKEAAKDIIAKNWGMVLNEER
jgi:hypothetical protein